MPRPLTQVTPQPPVSPRDAAIAVIQRLREHGHTALLAGGCVRDELLGLHPKDYDVATDAHPDRVHQLFPRARLVGAAFGVMQIPFRDSHDRPATTEVATFRAEGPYSDHRRPDAVVFTDAPNDAKRRDFTINALFLDPLAPPTPTSPSPRSPLGGQVIDHVAGLPDLHAKLIRAVGNPDARLNEDHLRALRAVRFTARLNFTIDPATAHAITTHAKALAGVSRERIGDEFRKMLIHPTRAAAAALLQSLHLDSPTLDEPAQPAPHRSTLPALAALPREATFPAALAAWAIDRAPDAALLREAPTITALTSRYRRALCLSNDESDALRATLQTWADLQDRFAAATTARQIRLAARPAFLEALCLLAATQPASAQAIRDRVQALGYEPNPNGIPLLPLVTGDDLIAIGLRPGPAFKSLLDSLLDAQLEHRIHSKEEGLELARRSSV
jgi:poly(A) polymerase